MQASTHAEAWGALEEHARALRGTTLSSLFSADPERFEHFSLKVDGILLDYSKQHLTEESMRLLLALAEEAALPAWRERLFSGARVNPTEQRPALHMLLREPEGPPLEVDGADVRPQIASVLARMEAFADAVRSGSHRGATGETITDVIHIGIGGSDLGPRLALQAMAARADGPCVHFVSNIDGVELAECTAKLNPARTLVSIASKSFGTRETLVNATAARDWLKKSLGGDLRSHLVAITAAGDKAQAFGLAQESIFPLWDWVGGRYSLWSAVGLPVVLGCGMKAFRRLLAGAAAMDRHFQEAPLAANMPVLLALIGVWSRNFLAHASLAVIPYSERLRHLPAYLQQLEMESNGKRVSLSGEPIGYQSVPVIWGQTGTVGQHAFFQALHQGTQVVPCDFIGIARTDTPYHEHHTELMANLFAQTEALMQGQSEAQARARMREKGLDAERIEALLPFQVFPGDRPSNTLLLDELSPERLGALLALYEHKVFCQAVIWRLNAFDQMGVELGKRLADRLLPELAPDAEPAEHDSSTSGLVRQYRQWCYGKRR